MNEYNLRPLWDELLKIYKVFASICDKHHLRYYACGGTALGAVRHKGFIPWDDDIDMFMPRHDYTQFIELAKSELPEGFSWQSIEVDSKYRLPFGKVWNSGKRAAIDILPLDGIPKNRVHLFFWLAWRSLWRHLPQFLTNSQAARLKHQRFLAAIDFDCADKVEDSKESARRLRRTAWTPETFGEPIWMDFDSVKVPLPRAWDQYLRGMFGLDYMTLPPVEKRVPCH